MHAMVIKKNLSVRADVTVSDSLAQKVGKSLVALLEQLRFVG